MPRLTAAVVAGMRVVRTYQGRATPAEVKADKTLVTQVDHKSEQVMLEVLEGIPETYIWAEEGGPGSEKEKTAILIDPLDGTRAFTNGLMTSTVIAATYEHTGKCMSRCVIGEPASGRIWCASRSTDTRLIWYEFVSGDHRPDKIPSCWGKHKRVSMPLDQCIVFLDVSHGFTRKGRKIFTDKQTAQLFGLLNSEVKILMPGSNGLHQALVANGDDSVAGSITLAIGGPWDVCGALLVERSGGSCRAYKMGPSGLVECSPLDVYTYDILVTATTPDVANYLAEKILEAGML